MMFEKVKKIFKNAFLMKLFYLLVILFILFLISTVITEIISISTTFFYVSLIFKVIILFSAVILLGWIYLSYKDFQNTDNKKRSVIKIIITLGLIWLIFQLLIIGGLNFEYSSLNQKYSSRYQKLLDANSNDYLNSSWDLTQQYRSSFDGTYNVIGAIIPSRNLNIIPYSMPIIEYYFNSLNGFQKMIVIQQKGNCGEFSQSIVFFLNDTTHFPTRLVIFEGIDHMMPEIEIDHQWWVFDQVYLTSDRPIISENLSKHISEDTRNNIAFIYYSNKEHSLLKQHGFNETQLTINTILDMPANPMSGKPLKGVNVEIFTTKNSHDPLVAKGITDYNGQFSTLLNSDKEYLIFATYEFLPLFPKFAGTGFIPKSTVNNISITIPITKYG